MTIIQILAILFSLFAVSRVILRTIDGKLKFHEFIFWNFIWTGLVATTFFPDLISRLANVVGIGRGVDIIIYFSIGTLFYLMFRLYVKLEETDQQLTKVIRELAYMKKKGK